MRKLNTPIPLLLWSIISLLTIASSPAARADRLWWDGSRDGENAPPGKLLSDNVGYWGDVVLTDVEYHYETAPDSPRDIWRDDATRFGRRLLDGVPIGDWHVPVGLTHGPLVTVFDFKRQCAFNEVDVVTQSNKVALKIECADAASGPWRVVFERSLEACPDKNFQRVPLAAQPLLRASGRWLRLSVQAANTTYLNEVLVWGDAEVSPATPEAFKPVAPLPVANAIAFPSIPGIDKSSLSDAQFRDWQRAIGAAARLPVVWSSVPTWDSITTRPILPTTQPSALPASLVMARNETECAALALTNTSMLNPATGAVALSEFHRIGGAYGKNQKSRASGLNGDLKVMGAMPSRSFGVNLGPLLSADNMPGSSLLQRYLTNGAGIQDFPRLTLSPAGSAVLWLSVTSQAAEPGIYAATLSYQDKSGRNVPQTVRVEVLDVTLPQPFVWMQTWSDTTSMFPFVYGDRATREVGYKQSLGVTVWNSLPTPGSNAALARQHGRALYQVFALPMEYVNKGYNNQIKPEDITAKDEAAITDYVHALVKQTKALGLSYDDWYGELWDEPGRNAPLFGALARIIKQADPQVRLYINPIFWTGNGVDDDATVYKALNPWFNANIDVSVPAELLLQDHPQSYRLFAAPRRVRAFYNVTTHVTEGEQAAHVERHRRFAWEAFKRGWNGWGFYSYYAPRGNPWDDFDEDASDYLMVYPGPRGPIPTRAAESVREGWEDYRLLTLLQQRAAKEPQVRAELAAIFKAYAANEPLGALRLRALRAAAPHRQAPRK